MHVIVKARHMNLTQALRSYAEEKLGASLRKIADSDAMHLLVELDDLGQLHRHESNKACRIHVYMPRHRPLILNEVDSNMYKAIDLAHDRILTLVKRELERSRTSRLRKAHASAHLV